MTVTLKNDALNYQPGINGTYFLSDIVNSKPSWTLNDNNKGFNQAIWYVDNDWAIGALENIGTTIRNLKSNGQGFYDLFNVRIDKWSVWNDNDKIWTATDTNDVTIQCKGKVHISSTRLEMPFSLKTMSRIDMTDKFWTNDNAFYKMKNTEKR